jgi:FkbM family methyltransferase
MVTYYEKIKSLTTIHPKNILEIGSRDGNDALIMKNLFNLDDSKVWVVEPNPKQIKVIENSHPNFNLVPYAIFNESTEHDFYQVEGNMAEVGTSSLVNRNDSWYNGRSNVIKVKTITGEELIDMIGEDIDICKLDVEGLSYKVLVSFGDKLNKIKSFHIECEHTEIWESQKLYSDVSEYLTHNNYTQIHFEYCPWGPIQSDSIWVINTMIK